MKNEEARGFLVVIEGVDGTGKSTLIRRLQAHCEGLGMGCVLSREPTNGVWGTRLRESARTGRLPLEEELELFLRDRKEHVDELILPALGEGKVVLLDRYFISSAAYQGARGADPEQVLRRNEEFAPAPDLVLLLDCDPEQTLQRVRARGDVADEFEKLDALRRVRALFLAIRRPYIRVIDAAVGAEQVAGEAIRLLEPLFSKRDSRF
jgi:dTMP kinase